MRRNSPVTMRKTYYTHRRFRLSFVGLSCWMTGGWRFGNLGALFHGEHYVGKFTRGRGVGVVLKCPIKIAFSRRRRHLWGDELIPPIDASERHDLWNDVSFRWLRSLTFLLIGYFGFLLLAVFVGTLDDFFKCLATIVKLSFPSNIYKLPYL